MFNKIVFFEYRHYGDIFLTRNFIKYICNNIKVKNYEYILKRDYKAIKDIPDIKAINIKDNKYDIAMYSDWKIEEDVFFINTSLGANNFEYYNGCNIQTAYNLFTTLLEKTIGHIIQEDIYYFVPTIDFSYFDISKIDIFMDNYDKKNKVLIVNGETESGQALNFDMDPIIDYVSNNFDDYIFFLSNESDFKFNKNVFFCKDIIKSKDECDIMETVYFSKFCNTIIGRSSGVYTMSFMKENILDQNKKFICFSHKDIFEGREDFGFSSLYPDLKKRIIFDDNYESDNMISLIINNIKG